MQTRKITKADRELIRKLAREGWTIAALSQRFQVAQYTIKVYANLPNARSKR